MNWQPIIEFLGGATAISLVLGYLGKRAIDGFMSGRLEAYKSELGRLTIEHNVRYQRLHAERAEVIKEFYARLAVLDDTLHSTLRPFQLVGEPRLAEKVAKLSSEFNSLREYFIPRRIFFDEALCKVVDDILELAKGIFFDLTTYEVDPEHPEYKYNREVLKERHEFWELARGKHKEDFPNLKQQLEQQFRAMLGIQP